MTMGMPEAAACAASVKAREPAVEVCKAEESRGYNVHIVEDVDGVMSAAGDS